MKIALTLPHLPLSGVGTSVAIIEKGLTDAGYKVDVVITGHEVGNDFQFAEKSGWNLVLPGRGIRYLPHRLKRVAEVINLNEYSMVINNTSIETHLILPCLKPEILRVAVMRVLNPDALSHLAINSEYLHAAVGISAEMTRVMLADTRIKAPVRLISNSTRVKGGEFPLLGDRLQLCSVGRLTNPDKNVKILPRIAKLLMNSGVNFSIEIVGDGPVRQWLEKEFKRLSVGDVKLHGELSREQTQQIMSHSNFVLLPSVREGLSNVMLEGMALGCVPVCSDIENFKWVLGVAFEHLKCGLDNPEDYAQRIAYLVGHPNVYQDTQHYLQKRQKKMFTPEQTVRGYLDLINELKSGKRRNLPPACDFGKLPIPNRYLLYCSPAWRLLQKIKDKFIGS